MNKVINISSNGIKQAIDDLVNENEMLQDKVKEQSLLLIEFQDMEQRLKEKESIIKEAREYIKDKYDYLLGDDTFLDHDERIDRKQIKHILGILDGSDKE